MLRKYLAVAITPEGKHVSCGRNLTEPGPSGVVIVQGEEMTFGQALDAVEKKATGLGATLVLLEERDEDEDYYQPEL